MVGETRGIGKESPNNRKADGCEKKKKTRAGLPKREARGRGGVGYSTVGGKEGRKAFQTKNTLV